MNYIKELNAFRNWLLLHDLSSGAILLWHTLMSINNMAGWSSKFNANEKIIHQLTGLPENRLAEAHKQLLDHDLIVYHKGCKGRSSVYQMVSMDEKMNQSTGKSQHQDAKQYNPPLARFEGKNEEGWRVPFRTDSVAIHNHHKEEQVQSRHAYECENPFDVYRKNFGILGPVAIEAISAWCRELGDEIVIAGIKLAVKRGGLSLRCIEEILKEWTISGLVSMEQVWAYEKQKSGEHKKLHRLPPACR